jgi:hypothetical protein
MSDSIIVYRNPLEKAFWENQNNCMGITFTFAISMGITFFVVYQVLSFCGRRFNWWRCWSEPQWVSWVAGCAGIFMGCLACRFVM